MGRNRLLLCCVTLVLPIAVEVPSSSPDSTLARFTAAGGTGALAMVVRDCEGNAVDEHRVHFRDGGAAMDVHGPYPLHAGVRAGVVHDGIIGDNSYVNPNLSFEWSKFGFGTGRVFSRKEFLVDGGDHADIPVSGHLRIGNLDRRYFSMELMESVPLDSDGGYFDLGLGYRPSQRLRMWTGIGVLPYDQMGLMVRSEWRMTPHLRLNANARAGSSESIFEGGISAGVTWDMFRSTAPRESPMSAARDSASH
jgi:hypothetical protein